MMSILVGMNALRIVIKEYLIEIEAPEQQYLD